MQTNTKSEESVNLKYFQKIPRPYFRWRNLDTQYNNTLTHTHKFIWIYFFILLVTIAPCVVKPSGAGSIFLLISSSQKRLSKGVVYMQTNIKSEESVNSHTQTHTQTHTHTHTHTNKQTNKHTHKHTNTQQTLIQRYIFRRSKIEH